MYLITTPAVFLNQTHLVRLGIFHLELGKKHTFWLWEWGLISAPNFGDREPWQYTRFSPDYHFGSFYSQNLVLDPQNLGVRVLSDACMTNPKLDLSMDLYFDVLLV